MSINLWTSSEHALDYLSRADSIPHRVEGEATLLEFISPTAKTVLDLGTGDGRLLALVKLDHPDANATAIDFSPAMLEAARKRFEGDNSVTVKAHNLDRPLPTLGRFDAIVSSFAIHHLTHERKRELYAEIYTLLNQGGVFCNLEHVSSPTPNFTKNFYTGSATHPKPKTPQTSCSRRKLNSHGYARLVSSTSIAAGSGANWRSW